MNVFITNLRQNIKGWKNYFFFFKNIAKKKKLIKIYLPKIFINLFFTQKQFIIQQEKKQKTIKYNKKLNNNINLEILSKSFKWKNF